MSRPNPNDILVRTVLIIYCSWMVAIVVLGVLNVIETTITPECKKPKCERCEDH